MGPRLVTPDDFKHSPADFESRLGQALEEISAQLTLEPGDVVSVHTGRGNFDAATGQATFDHPDLGSIALSIAAWADSSEG
jgi:hypothetical protein